VALGYAADERFEIFVIHEAIAAYAEARELFGMNKQLATFEGRWVEVHNF
jgi:hypothetical protein